MPDLLVALVKRLVRWGVLPARMAPDSAIINIYDKVGCCADRAPFPSDYRHRCPRQVARLCEAAPPPPFHALASMAQLLLL